MKVLAVLGSRNPDGQTARATDAFLQGAADRGALVAKVMLPPLRIERCRQCDNNGWGLCRSEGRCAIEDDFADVVAKIKDADFAVFGNPVYFSDLSESLRAFLDRLRRVCRHEKGKERVTGKPAIGICVAGGGGGGAPTCVASMEKVLATCGFDVLDMVPCRRQNLDLKTALLRTAGQWYARGPEEKIGQ
jgi:multimeric flavodoxin WrbA